MSWPALRSIPVPMRVAVVATLCGCFSVFPGVPIAAVAIAIWGDLLAETVGLGNHVAVGTLHEVAYFVGGSAVLSIFVFPLAVPIAFIALRLGVAGWGVALLAGGALGASGGGLLRWGTRHLIEATVYDVMSFTVAGVILGGVFWLGARVAVPSLFKRPGTRINHHA